MNLLIETSTERGAIAIAITSRDTDTAKILFHRNLPFGYQNSKHLLPAIQEALHDTGLEVKQLTYIAVGIGPGSYTGIRVGASVAKALAFAANFPLVGLSSLYGFIPDKNCRFAAMIDAKIGGAYLIFGERGNGVIKYLSQPDIQAIDKAIEKLNEHGVEVICTPNSERLKTLFPEHLEWMEMAPNVGHMMELAEKKFRAGEYSLDGSVELMYLRGKWDTQ